MAQWFIQPLALLTGLYCLGYASPSHTGFDKALHTSILCHVASATEGSTAGYLVGNGLESIIMIGHLK